MKGFITDTIHAAEVNRRVKENILRVGNEEMKGAIKTLVNDMALINGRLKIGTMDEIAIVEKAESGRV